MMLFLDPNTVVKREGTVFHYVIKYFNDVWSAKIVHDICRSNPHRYTQFLVCHHMNDPCYNSTNLDGKNEDGDTALIQAIKKKYIDTIRALLRKGASKLILLVQVQLKKLLLYRAITSRQLPFSACLILYLCLHESSNSGSTHFQSQTEFQSTNRCGLSQSGLQSRLGAFTLEVNLG